MSAPALTVNYQGLGSVSADGLNTYEQTCDTVAQLRSFTGITGIEVSIRGTTTPNDGGGGPFYWNATSTAADDNGATTVRPNGVLVGAWTRLGYYAGSGGSTGGNGGLIQTNNVTLFPNFSYGVKTGSGAYTVLLPSLSTVGAGSIIELQDVDFNAFTNNITISANGSDEITYQASSALTWTLNINGVIGRLRANGTYWRATFYGS